METQRLGGNHQPAPDHLAHVLQIPELGRYPAIDPATFRRAVEEAFGSGR